MHLKRSSMPREWPLPRKGTKYLGAPSHNLKRAIPLVVVLRDVLGLVKTKKEAKNLLNDKKIKVNYKAVKDVKYGLSLFDILSLGDKNLKLILKNRKFNVAEVKGKEAEEKIVKVTGKTMLKGKKTQVNLADGRNYITDKNLKLGDSVAIDLKNNKILEVIQFKEGSKVMLTTGKHLGETGEVEKIVKKMVYIKIGSEKIDSRVENLMVIG